MAPYASVEQLQTYYGADRIRTSLPKDVLDADVEDHLLIRLDSVAGLIDSYLMRGGYTTPIDTTVITDSVAKARLDALLVEVSCALVGQSLFTGQRGAGAGQEKARDWAMKWLEGIASGTLSIIGLTRSSSRIAVVGTADPSIPDSLFTTIRYPFR